MIKYRIKWTHGMSFTFCHVDIDNVTKRESSMVVQPSVCLFIKFANKCTSILCLQFDDLISKCLNINLMNIDFNLC